MPEFAYHNGVDLGIYFFLCIIHHEIEWHRIRIGYHHGKQQPNVDHSRLIVEFGIMMGRGTRNRTQQRQ